MGDRLVEKILQLTRSELRYVSQQLKNTSGHALVKRLLCVPSEKQRAEIILRFKMEAEKSHYKDLLVQACPITQWILCEAYPYYFDSSWVEGKALSSDISLVHPDIKKCLLTAFTQQHPLSFHDFLEHEHG